MTLRVSNQSYDLGGKRISLSEFKHSGKKYEVFVGARKNNKRIGFGPDGSVEFERLTIVNPPTRAMTDAMVEITERGEKTLVPVTVEDPELALKQIVERFVEGHGKQNARVVPGKRGKSTLVAYCAGATGGGSVDGEVETSGQDDTLANVRADTGTGVIHTSTFMYIELKCSATTDQFQLLARGIMTFDTSSLGASASISDATLDVYWQAQRTVIGTIDSMEVVGATPATDDSLVAGDYNQTGTTGFGSITSFTGAGYKTATLNASGISNIDKEGVSGFGLLTDWDYDNNFDGTWVDQDNSWRRFFQADWNSGAGAPFLTVTYSASSGTNAQLQIGDAWKTVDGMQVNIGDSWKTVDGAQVNIGDSWKTIF